MAKIATHLDRSRWIPHVATYSAAGMRYDELVAAGIPVLHIPVSTLRSRGALHEAFRMRRYIQEHGIRLVHAWDNSAAFTAPVARACRVPVVLSSQLSYRSLASQRSRNLTRITDRLVDGIVVNCEAMRRHLVEDVDYPADRIRLCYNGVDTSVFYPLEEPKPEAVRDAPLVIGALCVLRPEKALDLLQEGFARVRHLKPGIKLMIVGGGPELPRLEAHGRRLGIEDSTVFIPTTKDVPRYLRAMDIFVLSSKSESFSNALLEAMACGCCPAATRVGGTPEMLGENERGLLFQSGDANGLAEALATLISNESLRHSLAAKAAEFARNSLSIEMAAACIAGIYEAQLTAKAWRRPACRPAISQDEA